MAEQLHHLQRVVFLIAGVFLAAAITAFPAHAQQPPPLPQAFYGSVEVNGQPAAVGAQIEGRGAGVKVGIQGNPLSVTVAGRYGGRTIAEPKLGVQGVLDDGTPIEFYIDGVKAECARPGDAWRDSYPFTSGVVTELNLRAGQNATPTATQQSTPTLTATSPSTSLPTSTPTATLAAGNTQRQDSPAPTATRQTPQPAGGGTSPQPTAGSGTPSPNPPAPVAQPTNLQAVLITQPTQLASQSTAPIQSPTPALAGEMARATSVSFTATLVAQPTAPPASATPAAIAQVSDSTPRPTSQPILSGESRVSTQSSPAQSVPAPSANAFGGSLAPLGGVAVLVIAAVVGGVLVVRKRSG